MYRSVVIASRASKSRATSCYNPRPSSTETTRPRPPGSQRGARTTPCPPPLLGPRAARQSPHTLAPSRHRRPAKQSERRDDGGRVASVHVPAAAVAEVRGAVRAVRVAPAGRAPQLPRLPRLAVRGPLHHGALRRVVVRVPPPRRRRALRAPPRRHPGRRPAAALRRAGPGLPHPGRRARVPVPRPPPRPRGRHAPPALPRQPPPRLRGGAGGVRRAARPLLPRARGLRAPVLPRRRRVPGVLVRRRRARVPVAVVGRRRLRRRRRVLGIPHRALLHGLHHLPDHMLPPDPADGGIRAGVRTVRRRRRRAAAPPTDQGAPQEDQPPVPQVHSLQPRTRLRQPVRHAARHHQAARHCQSRHRRRARADLAEPGGGPAAVPPERGEDHAQDAGHHKRGRGVARRRHRPRLRQRPGEPGPGPAGRRGLPGARERLPPGRRRRVLQRRRRQPERGLRRRHQVRPVPGHQHLLPEEAGAGDVPGEQPSRYHGVRLRGGPVVAPRALHDRVLTRHVAAREDGRDLMNYLACSGLLMQGFVSGCTNPAHADSSEQCFLINAESVQPVYGAVFFFFLLFFRLHLQHLVPPLLQRNSGFPTLNWFYCVDSFDENTNVYISKEEKAFICRSICIK